MTMQDSYLPLECTLETLDEGITVELAECSFCDNVAIPDYEVNYPRTGVVRHCRGCAIEYGANQ